MTLFNFKLGYSIKATSKRKDKTQDKAKSKIKSNTTLKTHKSQKKLFLILLSTLCFSGSIFQAAPSFADPITPTPAAQSPSPTSLPPVPPAPPIPLKPNEILKPSEALKRLMEGNKRFTEDKTTCTDRNQMRRAATVASQKPFAIILGCSDSRVPPEIAFDQGIGDVFVVRVAGNVVSAIELSSVEYSAVQNNSSILVVLGHANCGAVTAVLENKTQGIEAIAKIIQGGLARFNPRNEKLNLQSATEANIKNSVMLVKQSPVIDKLIHEGKLMVVGAYYDLKTGEVRILDTAQTTAIQR